MTLGSQEIANLVAIAGAVFAAIGGLWAVFNQLINKHHKNSERIEHQKIELQRELEATKQGHLQKLIDTIRHDMAVLAQKIDEVRKAYFALDKKIAGNEGRTQTVLNAIHEFHKETTKRFVAVEKQVQILERQLHEVDTKVDSQMEQIGKDLFIIREAARKVKKGD